jgi:hypothetical protein
MKMALNWEKFKAVVHYICNKPEDPSVLGAIKLNKVLWYSDSIRYLITGNSITGETYVKRQYGPVPKHILKAVDELVSDGKIARGKVDHFGFVKSEFIAIQEPNVDIFSPSEVALIDEAFEHVCLNNTAKSISEETHGLIWELASMGEDIPLYTVFASMQGEIHEEDISWAKSVLHPA